MSKNTFLRGYRIGLTKIQPVKSQKKATKLKFLINHLKRDCVICEVKARAMISCVVTAQLGPVVQN